MCYFKNTLGNNEKYVKNSSAVRGVRASDLCGTHEKALWTGIFLNKK